MIFGELIPKISTYSIDNPSVVRRRSFGGDGSSLLLGGLSAMPTAYQYVGSFVLFIKEAYSFVVKKTICFSELKKLN